MRRSIGAVICLVVLGCAVGAQRLSEKLKALTAADIAPLTARAEAGDYDAQIALAYAYEKAYAVPRDYAQALAWFTRADDIRPNGEIEFHVAGLLRHGVLGAPDLAKEFAWTLRAAQHGQLTAQFNVSSMYGNGRGTPRDLEAAERWLRTSADNGFSQAQYVLGMLYAAGKLGPANIAEAERWLTRAADQNHEQAITELAKLYMGPQGVPLDRAKVEKWLLKAADMDNAPALFQLGGYYRDRTLGEPNLPKAILMYTEAARDGYAPAQVELARMHENGEGVSRDPAAALTWYSKAAELGYTPAMIRAGQMFRDASGTAPNPDRAAFWFAVGAQMGDRQAREELDTLEKRIPGIQPAAGNLAAQFLQSHPEAAANQPGHFTYHSGIVVWDPSDKLKRGPSTLAERQKAIEAARLLERAPLAPSSSELRKWLDDWWRDIPDFMIKTCEILPIDSSYPYASLLQTQVTLSSGAYLLDKRYEVQSQEELYEQGLRGALRAYQAILTSHPGATSPVLDTLVSQMNSGSLPSQVPLLMSKRCH